MTDKQHHRRKPAAEESTEARFVLGIHPISELLATSPETIVHLWVAPPPHRPQLAELVALAKSHHIKVDTEPMVALDRRGQGVRHQGAIAEAKAFPYQTLEHLLPRLGQRALIVLLDSLQDPHNLGAIVRSSCAFAADAVVIPKDRSVQVTPLVERASAGTTARLPIVRVTNLKRAMELLKENGFWLVGAAAHGGQNLSQFEFPDRVGLVIGAEGDGMRAQVEATLDFVLTIPLSGPAESLNASNAAAVLLYELARRRAV